MLSKESINLSDIRLKKAQDSLKQSKILLENHMYDGSINRSYYAVFYAVRCLLALIEMDSSKHSGVISLFDRYYVKSNILEKEYSKIAHTTFDIRQDSDYDDFFYPREEEATSQYKNAARFVNEVQRIQIAIVNKELSLPDLKNQ